MPGPIPPDIRYGHCACWLSSGLAQSNSNTFADVDGKQTVNTVVQGSFPGVDGRPSADLTYVLCKSKPSKGPLISTFFRRFVGSKGGPAMVPAVAAAERGGEVGEWGVEFGPDDGDIRAVLAQTQAKFQTMLDGHRDKFLAKYGDLFRPTTGGADLFGADADPSAYE